MISQEMFIFLQISALLSLFISVIFSVIAVISLAKVIGMEKSTHQVTYMPIDPEVDKENQEYMKWATDEETLKEQKKYFTEDLEDSMPEFMPDDEDKKIHSF